MPYPRGKSYGITQRLSSYTHYDGEGDVVEETTKNPSLGLAGPDYLDELAENHEREAKVLRALAQFWRSDLWRAA